MDMKSPSKHPSSSSGPRPAKEAHPHARHRPNDLDVQEGQERMQSHPKNPQPYERKSSRE